MKRSQVGADAKDFHAGRVEENHRRGVSHIEFARPCTRRTCPAVGSDERGRRHQRESRDVEALDLAPHRVAMETFPMQLVARRAIDRLEEDGERLAVRLAPQIVRRSQEERLVVPARTRGAPSRGALLFRHWFCAFEESSPAYRTTTPTVRG